MILWFLMWRLIDFIISLVAGNIFTSTHHYILTLTHKENIFHLPGFILSFANFDGVNYLHISQEGYGLYQQTYFPLFPLIIHILSPVFLGSAFLTGFVLANVCFFFGLLFFKHYLQSIKQEKQTIMWSFIFLLAFPTSFFFGSVYTEGLFFFLVTGTLYFLSTKQYIKIALFGFLAALTRLMGVFLVLPMLAILYLEPFYAIENVQKNLQQFSLFFRRKLPYLVILIAPVLGIVAYMFYLLLTTNDALAFYHSQLNFNTGRSTHIILLPQVYYRYIRILLETPHNFTYFVALVEFMLFNLVFLVLLYDLWQLWRQKKLYARINLIGLNIFSLVNLLLPTFTGTFSSIPRYELFSLSFFIRIAKIKNLFIRIIFLIFFILLHIVLLALFAQGYFIS